MELCSELMDCGVASNTVQALCTKLEMRLAPKAPDTLMLARHFPTHDGDSWVDELDTAL